MSDETPTKRAEFVVQGGSQERIPVQFNPVSLQLSVTNTMEDKGKDKKQYVSKSTAKLTMDLVFDTTHSGQDVRIDTEKIVRLMKPDEQNKNAPPVVLFDWGTFKFKGIVESYKETIDFFSPTGVPLRASVNLSLSQQEKVFDSNRNPDGAPPPEPVEAFTPEGDSVTDVATRGGDPGASRALAAANGLESMRFPSGAVSVSASVSLSGPVAFASGGAGIGIGGGAGIGIGGGASAGVSATEGAFAGLRATTEQRASFSLNTSRLTQSSSSLSLATDSGASFSVGGQASIQGSASLSADVGASASMRARIKFEE